MQTTKALTFHKATLITSILAGVSWLAFYFAGLSIDMSEVGFSIFSMVSTVSLFLFLPYMIYLAQHYPIRSERLARQIVVHIIACAYILILKGCFDWAVSYQLQVHIAYGAPWYDRLLRYITHLSFPLNAIYYFGLLGVVYAEDYYRKYRRREIEAAQLEAELAKSQLQLLQLQLQPHFLFNTLNVISTLVYKDPASADQAINNLSHLLRYILNHIGIQEVSLKDEIELLQQYLEIEKLLYGDRLQVEYDINPETLDACVPNMILQPLVENSIRHGIAKISQPGKIRIETAIQDHTLRIHVIDNGPGPTPSEDRAKREGIGLTNTMKRLAQLYGPSHRFELKHTEEGDTMVAIEIPYKEKVENAGSSYGTNEDPNLDRG